MTPHHPTAIPDGAVPPPGCPAHVERSGLQRLAEITDPSGTYEDLRRRYGAVAPVLLHGDIPAWLVLGYRENLDVMRTPRLYARDSRHWIAFQEGRVAADSPLVPMVGWQPMCAFVDGAEHARLRSAVVDSLDAISRHGMRRYVKYFTHQLVARFAESGRADLVGDFVERLPMLVASRIIGMSPDKGPLLVEPTLDLIRGSETAPASNRLVTRVLEDLVAHKASSPGEMDLATRLLAHDSALDRTEVVEHLRLILVAAHQNTVNLLTQTLRLILTDEGFRGRLSGGTLTLPEALDQVMWDNPSLNVLPGRWALADHTLAGQQIKKGDMLLMGIAAAHVDPEQRPDLTVSMSGNRAHLALGSGPHACPGGDIGRAIADTGIEVLFELLPDIHLAVPNSEIRITTDWMTSRPSALPVAFTPRRSADISPQQPPRQAAGPLPPSKESVEPPTTPSPRPSKRWRRLLSRARTTV
ncbi:cytochrome P450 [Streptomyces sp. NPDC127084]|uniref:cytochrome P450 n=1 Tax=Streptomyces sp. NPDC127084 TaxID=3347133 RepID=UPI00364BD105